ncbi:MAG: histone H1 [Acidobacteriota bacterium]|nr:histone H1 [Acidobacteriota bacterium]
MPSDSKRPRDPNQLAKYIVDQSTGEIPKEQPPQERPKNPAAVALGKLGASKGGKARAEKLSDEERKEIARRAAEARWKKDVKQPR